MNNLMGDFSDFFSDVPGCDNSDVRNSQSEYIMQCDNCKHGHDYADELDALDITCENSTVEGFARFDGFFPLKSFSCSLWEPK
jgi:hypothetical protein